MLKVRQGLARSIKSVRSSQRMMLIASDAASMVYSDSKVEWRVCHGLEWLTVAGHAFA